jgi:hypothetical protein
VLAADGERLQPGTVAKRYERLEEKLARTLRARTLRRAGLTG